MVNNTHLHWPASLELRASSIIKRAIAVGLIVAGMLGEFSIFNLSFSIPSAHAAAGINRVINYQGKVSVSAGSAVTNGTYNMRFKLFDAPTGGNILWSEPWTNATTRVTMTGGLFSVGLGTHVTMTGSVNFNSDNLYLQVEFDPGNDGTFEEVFSPRRRFGSVVYAHNADTIDGIDSTEFLRKNQANTMTGSLTVNNTSGNAITVRGALSGALIHASTSLSTSGSLTVNGAVKFKSFTGCVLIATDAQGNLSCSSTPAVSTGTIVAIGDSRYVNTSGDTMTGALTINVTNGTIGTVGLNVKNTISGAVIRAQKTLASSGGLAWEGAASGSSLYVASSIQGAGLADCDIGATSKLLWDSSTGRFFCGSDQTGNAAVYLQDSFTDSNGTSLGSHTMDVGPGWTIVSGSFEIQNAAARDTFDGGAPIAVSDAGSSDGVASVTVLPWTGNNSTGLIGRYVDSNNYWMLSTNTPANNVVLYEVTGGGLTNRADISYSFDSDTPYTLKLVFDGTSIEVYIDNTLQASYTSSAHQSATRFGLRSFHDTNVGYTETNYDNFSVTSIGDGSVPFSSGNVLTIGDSRYVRTSGGTMTGALTINVTGGNNSTVGLNVLNTISGAVIRAQKTLASSGTLVFEGAASGSSLYIATSLQGAGLTDCDIAGTSKLLWDSSTGRFSCGTDTDTNTQFSNTGSLRTAFDSRYVRTSGGTMTGALTINVTGGNNSTIGLNVLNTISGAVIRAQKSLNSSGTLVFEGAASGSSLYIATSLQGAGLTDCDLSTQTLAWDASTGRFSCGTDSDTTYTAGQGLTLTSTSFRVADSISGSLLEFQTVSGSTVYGSKSVRSSGSLVWEGAATGATLYVATSINGAGLVDCDIAGTSKLLWDSSTGRFSCGTDTDTNTQFSNTGALRAAFDARYVNTSGDTMTGAFTINVTGGNNSTLGLNVLNTISGAIIRAQKTLASSGTLVTESGAYFDGTTMVIQADNNRVGIGTSTPESALHIYNATATLRIQDSAADDALTADPAIAFYTASGTRIGFIGDASPSGDLMNVLSDHGEVRITTLDNKPVSFRTNNAIRMTISGSGLIGIGTTRPETELEVIGTVSGSKLSGNQISIGKSVGSSIPLDVYSTTSALGMNLQFLNDSGYMSFTESFGGNESLGLQRGLIGFGDANEYATNQLDDSMFILSTSGPLQFGTIDNIGMTLTGSRLGIGTNTPNATLAVSGTVLIGTGSHANTTSAYALTVNAQSAPGLIERIAQFSASDTHGYFEFANGTSGNGGFSPVITGKATSNFPGFFLVGNTERDISASQNVLTFRGRIESGSLIKQISVGNLFQLQNSVTGVFTVRGSGATRIGTGAPNTNTQLDVLGTISGSLITQNGTGSNYFRGNVGIGTTTPNRGKLHVHDATESSVHITSQLSGSANTDGLFFGLNNNGTDATFWNFENGYLRFATNNTEQIRILSTGNVGIGTTVPKAKLDVAGSISGTLLTLSRMRNCTLKTSATGAVICGTDNAGGSSTGTTTLAKMSRVAAQSIPHNTNTNIDFDTEFYDVGDIANTTTNRFTIATTGKYLITAYAVTAGAMDAGEGFILYMNKNGVTVNYDVNYSIAADQSIVATVTDTLSLVPGDYIEMAVYHNEGAAVNTSVAHMSVVQIDGVSNLGTTTTGPFGIGTGTNLSAQATVYTSNTHNTDALLIRSRETTSTINMLRIMTDVGSTNNTVFRVSASGAVYADGVYNSAGADYAEWFASTDDLMPGETVCIDVTKPNTVKRCENDADSNIMGIVSTNPAFVGNTITGADGIMPPGYELVGLIGQVPTLVNDEGGAIRPGDSLTASSTPGVARKAAAGESTVGVALEAMDGTNGTINVLISRRNQSMTVEAVEDKVLKTIAAMEIEDEVELMISETLGDLNVDEQISTEVTRQLAGMTTQQQTIDEIQNELASLKAELDLLKTRNQEPGTITGSTMNGHLAASSLELDDTLVTGGDARVGGDLSVDGSITATSLFVPNGMTINGGIVMQGMLDTTELRVAQNAIVDGAMTINGSLTLGSGAYLNFGSGALSIGDLIVHNSLYVMGDVTIDGLATFMNNVEIKGELIVSDKHAGYAMIPAGGTGVTVHFGSGYTATPVVTASPDVPVLYGVGKSSATGFTIRLAAPATEDIIFAWHALSVGNPITTFVLKNEDDAMIFPLDTNNVPVSSSAAWNACIRNIPILDESGQPQSCARYHDAYTWTHPDLNISFIWNTSLNPAFLKVPDGYVPTVAESADSVADGINPELEEEVIEDVVPETDTGAVIVEPETNTGTTVIEEESSSSAAASSEAASSVPAEEVIEEPVVEGPVEEPVAEETPTVEEAAVEPETPAAE